MRLEHNSRLINKSPHFSPSYSNSKTKKKREKVITTEKTRKGEKGRGEKRAGEVQRGRGKEGEKVRGGYR